MELLFRSLLLLAVCTTASTTTFCEACTCSGRELICPTWPLDGFVLPASRFNKLRIIHGPLCATHAEVSTILPRVHNIECDFLQPSQENTQLFEVGQKPQLPLTSHLSVNGSDNANVTAPLDVIIKVPPVSWVLIGLFAVSLLVLGLAVCIMCRQLRLVGSEPTLTSYNLPTDPHYFELELQTLTVHSSSNMNLTNDGETDTSSPALGPGGDLYSSIKLYPNLR